MSTWRRIREGGSREVLAGVMSSDGRGIGPQWYGWEWGVRSLCPAASVLLVVAARLASGTVSPLLSVVLVLVSVGAGLLPDSGFAFALILGMGLFWLAEVPDDLSPWTVLAAGLILLAHLAATVAGDGPVGVWRDPVLLQLWVRRWGLLLVPAVVVWAVSRVLDGVHVAHVGLVTGASVAVLLAAVVLALRAIGAER